MNKKYIILLIVLVIVLTLLIISLKTVKTELQPISKIVDYDNINEENIIKNETTSTYINNSTVKNDIISTTITNSSYTPNSENIIPEENDNTTLNFDNVTFYATIENINEYNGKTTVLVKGLDENDINYRGKYTFLIKDYTEIISNNITVEKSYLKENQTVLIEFTGDVLESSPAQIDVLKIVIE